MLAAISADTSLPGRLYRGAHAAYMHARALPMSAWPQLDAEWSALSGGLHRLGHSPMSPPYTHAEQRALIGVVRGTLVALDRFQGGQKQFS